MEDERRLHQRLYLARPIDGWFGDYPVRLIDVSATGALIENTDTSPVGARALLRFFWQGQEVEITAETIRTLDVESGLRFTEESPVLLGLIAQSAADVLRAQQANLEGDREANVIGDETLTAASAGLRGRGYVTWRLEEEGWTRRRSLLPDQPPNGFTVAATEGAEQVEMLRQTWEKGDDEARRMTRLLAEISASTVRSKDR